MKYIRIIIKFFLFKDRRHRAKKLLFLIWVAISNTQSNLMERMLSVAAILMAHVLVTKIFGLKENMTGTTGDTDTISSQRVQLNLLDRHSQLKILKLI